MYSYEKHQYVIHDEPVIHKEIIYTLDSHSHTYVPVNKTSHELEPYFRHDVEHDTYERIASPFDFLKESFDDKIDEDCEGTEVIYYEVIEHHK